MSSPKSIKNSHISFKVYLCSIVVLFVASSVLFFTGHKDVAFIVSLFGMPLSFFSILAYVILIDSRKRWPDAGWIVRLGRYATLTQ